MAVFFRYFIYTGSILLLGDVRFELFQVPRASVPAVGHPHHKTKIPLSLPLPIGRRRHIRRPETFFFFFFILWEIIFKSMERAEGKGHYRYRGRGNQSPIYLETKGDNNNNNNI